MQFEAAKRLTPFLRGRRPAVNLSSPGSGDEGGHEQCKGLSRPYRVMLVYGGLTVRKKNH